jgi:hypothetical protein
MDGALLLIDADPPSLEQAEKVRRWWYGLAGVAVAGEHLVVIHRLC